MIVRIRDQRWSWNTLLAATPPLDRLHLFDRVRKKLSARRPPLAACLPSGFRFCHRHRLQDHVLGSEKQILGRQGEPFSLDSISRTIHHRLLLSTGLKRAHRLLFLRHRFRLGWRCV